MSRAHEIAASVRDPELPVLTLAELGVLRSVDVDAGRVRIRITPTYSGCPAVAEMRADLIRALDGAGYAATVDIDLSRPWTTDDITAEGRAKLAAAGIAPPGPVEEPVLLQLSTRAVPCPRCGSASTSQTSRFGPTPCTALRRCRDCGEPFEHVKPI